MLLSNKAIPVKRGRFTGISHLRENPVGVRSKQNTLGVPKTLCRAKRERMTFTWSESHTNRETRRHSDKLSRLSKRSVLNLYSGIRKIVGLPPYS